MKIIVDAMGGDNAPLEIVKGALAGQKHWGVDIALTGDESAIRDALAQCGQGELPQGVEIVPTSQTVDMCDDPATVFRRKKDTSMGVGLTMLREGKADALVSAGSTGALLTGATLITKRIHGIRRAAMQFAYLGSFYAQQVLGLARPRVGLLNIGAEDSKGTDLQKQTLARLRQAAEEGHLHFIGNIEANTALAGGCDVIVADGYSGNIMLKSVEGAAKLMSGELKKMLTKSAKTKLAYLLLKDGLADFKKMLDPNEVGGTALLGISRPVVKAHGSSNAAAFCNAVRQTIAVAESGIIADITQNVDKMKVTPEKD